MRDRPDVDDLRVIVKAMRSFCFAANKHPGGSLSSVELVTALFFSGVARLWPSAGRPLDRFVQSKGHAAAPMFAASWLLGYYGELPLGELVNFGELTSPIPRMPRRDPRHGIEMSSGSLGQGLSFGCGLALADRAAGRDATTFVLLGDAECSEGQVWEAAMNAVRIGLQNIVAIVDANGSGSVIKLPRSRWAGMWRSFGWDTREVDGHDLGAVRDVLSMAVRASGPACIVASTIKGRGLDEAIEGSNTLSATAPPAYLPEFDLPADMAAAAAVVTKFGLAGHGPLSEPERPRLRRADTIAALTPAPVGSSAVTKQVAGEVATALAGTPAFFASPDAIRNSGLLPWMTKVGSWSWENRSSNVLQLGIAEQDAASLMAGVAAGGGRPVLASMEGFYWRMLDQIRESICFMNLPVVLVGTSGGVGDLLGPMVQSDTCLLALRAMIGLEIFEASDINLAKVLIAEALDQAGPVYVRLPHEAMAVRTSLAELAGLDLSEGFLEARPEPAPDLVILTAGAMVTQALAVAGLAAGQQLSCRVLEVFAPGRFAALPADRKADLMPAGALVVTMHNAPSAVLKALAGDDAIAFGVDGYGHCGTSLADLYRAAGLDAQSVFAAVAPALGKTADARPAG